jgi:hypothetical protein
MIDFNQFNAIIKRGIASEYRELEDEIYTAIEEPIHEHPFAEMLEELRIAAAENGIQL